MLHHDFKRGTTIFIILKDGTKIIDKYIDTKSNTLICKNQKLLFKNIRSVTINKAKGE